jgi:hypothetical protein
MDHLFCCYVVEVYLFSTKLRKKLIEFIFIYLLFIILYGGVDVEIN